MGERYVCTLSHKLLEKAATELNETRDNLQRLKAIDELKSKFNHEKYGPLKRDDDLFLLRFLRARKFNQEKALKLLHNYHGIRKKFRELFDLVDDPKQVEDIMETGILYVVERPLQSGAFAVIYRPEKETNLICLYKVYAYGQICFDYMLNNEEYQICGVVIIDDLEHFDQKSLKVLPAKNIKRIMSLLQDATPVRIQSIHLFNEGRVMDFIFGLTKPFTKRRLTKRMNLHGKKYDDIHEEVDQTLLPPCMGGTGQDIVTASKLWAEKMRQSM